ncbi:hypothetical protein QVD17_05302 [Tagetes erecta]|uniref:Uncharacterized protein n=1 Tax=Tagetes erecta TaxID=13708 RepID=A0AAD8LE52_TARER|nr:hypothetical protein QVD17_05302 [Tagetes erecta]
MEHISLQPPPFCNLKSLKIHPVRILSDDEAHKYVRLATKVISYLREGSPTATFRMISYEELKEKEQQAQAFANASEAQHRMDEFQTMIKDEKTVIEEMSKTYMDGMNKAMESHEAETHDQGNAPMEKMNQYFERKMEQIKSCWEDTGVQIDRWRSKIEFIISQLSDIEALLLKDLPSIKRDKLQACFSSLRAEADTVVKNILHHMKAPQIHLFNLNDCFNELATTSLSS